MAELCSKSDSNVMDFRCDRLEGWPRKCSTIASQCMLSLGLPFQIAMSQIAMETVSTGEFFCTLCICKHVHCVLMEIS